MRTSAPPQGGGVPSENRLFERQRVGAEEAPHQTRLPSAAMPIHVRAEPGDYAPAVLGPGDPRRAEYIATKFFATLASASPTTRSNGPSIG
jgi:hypothetical protein